MFLREEGKKCPKKPFHLLYEQSKPPSQTDFFLMNESVLFNFLDIFVSLPLSSGPDPRINSKLVI